MPPNHHNPHEAIQPDFAADKSVQAHLALMERAIAEEAQAAKKARTLASAAEELLCQQEQVEKDAALTKECKKHKTKFTSVLNAKVPLEPICLPAQYTLKQMEGGNYVELYYFTNLGIAEAEEVTTAPSNGMYVWKQKEDRSHSLVKASSAKRGLKNDPTPNEKLSWEQFFEATP
ncbi:hypothetical protein V8B97DRAFT_2034153 [Scleroderma yunnanense]